MQNNVFQTFLVTVNASDAQSTKKWWKTISKAYSQRYRILSLDVHFSHPCKSVCKSNIGCQVLFIHFVEMNTCSLYPIILKITKKFYKKKYRCNYIQYQYQFQYVFERFRKCLYNSIRQEGKRLPNISLRFTP